MNNSNIKGIIKNNLRTHLGDIKGRRLVIWGADDNGKMVLDIIDELGQEECGLTEVSCFIDKNPDRQFVDFQGFKVLPVRDMAGKREDEYIILAGDFAGIVLNELESLGYGPNDYCRSFSEKDERGDKKIAVVTGSTKGIGKSIGLKLLKEGCHVVFNYAADDNAANLLKESLKAQGFEAFEIVKADMSDEKGMDGFIDHIKANYSHISYLILNSYVANYKLRFSETTRDKWTKTMNANLNFYFFMVKDLGDMVTDNGRIIFISSSASKHVLRDVPYGASKAGVNKLAQDIMPYFAKRGITCNVICPRAIHTANFDGRDKYNLADIEKSLVLKRMGQASEVASLAVHIIHNAYLNGSVIDCGFCDRLVNIG